MTPDCAARSRIWCHQPVGPRRAPTAVPEVAPVRGRRPELFQAIEDPAFRCCVPAMDLRHSFSSRSGMNQRRRTNRGRLVSAWPGRPSRRKGASPPCPMCCRTSCQGRLTARRRCRAGVPAAIEVDGWGVFDVPGSLHKAWQRACRRVERTTPRRAQEPTVPRPAHPAEGPPAFIRDEGVRRHRQPANGRAAVAARPGSPDDDPLFAWGRHRTVAPLVDWRIGFRVADGEAKVRRWYRLAAPNGTIPPKTLTICGVPRFTREGSLVQLQPRPPLFC